MSNDTNLTIVGFLTADPELKSTTSGLAVVNLTIASTPSKYDKVENTWVDGETTFMRASAWRQFAERIAANLKKGDKVIASGRLVTQSYSDKEGNKRSSIQLELESIGLDLSRPEKVSFPSLPDRPVVADWSEIPELAVDGNSPF